MATKHEEIKNKINDYANTNDTDVIIYFGDITRDEYESLAAECANRKLRKHVVVLMLTLGGDPNAAYRIARMLQEHYKTVSPEDAKASTRPRGTFSIYVDTLCKSAGTIVCLGADRLFLSEKAELGPIDAQLRKQDEVGERISGLTPIRAVQFLEGQSVRLFKRHFTELRDPNDLGFSTEMAAGIAAEITVGLMTAIYQQLDPIRLAEIDRSLSVALHYGKRLVHDGNLNEGVIENLLANYPSHGFVIDRKEASQLFSKVEPPTKELAEIMEYFRPLAEWTIEQDENLVVFASDEPTPPAPSDPAAQRQAYSQIPRGTPTPEAVT